MQMNSKEKKTVNDFQIELNQIKIVVIGTFKPLQIDSNKNKRVILLLNH
jgi:hypothetical protein